MPKSSDREILTLHRYFIWANRMRTEFEGVLERQRIGNGVFPIEAHMYMSLWYACLYVVIEGWNTLGLNDEAISVLLKSHNVSLLKRYRNGVFHFQRRYFDQRFLALIG